MLLDIVSINNDTFVKHTCNIRKTSKDGITIKLFLPLDNNLSFVPPLTEIGGVRVSVPEGLLYMHNLIEKDRLLLKGSRCQVSKDSILYRFDDIIYMFEVEIVLNSDGSVRKARYNQLRYSSCMGFVLELKKVVAPIKEEYLSKLNGILSYLF